MKKIIFLLAIALIGSQVAGIAQTRVGIAAGVSVASMHGSEAEAGSSRAGVIGTFMLETPLNKSFSFRPSISYVQKGETFPHPTGTLIDKSYIGLRYAEFQADFLYYISGGATGGFFIGAGPSIAFNLPSKRVTVTDDVKTTKTVQFGGESPAEMRGTDWGVNFTSGWRTAGGFLITANYNKGLRNLVIDGNDGDLNNMYFGIKLGWFINNK